MKLLRAETRLAKLGGTKAAALALAALAADAISPGEGKSTPPRLQDQRPNIVVVMTDDQTPRGHEGPGPNSPPDRRSRRDVHQHDGLVPAVLSLPLELHERPVHAQPRRQGERPARGGYDAFDFSNALGVWLQKAGYYTAHVGKQLNYYGLSAKSNPTTVPPGYDDWYVPVDPFTYSFYHYPINHNGSLSFFGGAPADYQTDVLARHAEQVIRQRAGKGPFYLKLAPVAPHTELGFADPARSLTEYMAKGESAVHIDPRPAPRHVGAFANEPMVKSPAYNEEDVSDKPASIQERPPLDEADTARIERTYRARLESLLAVDDAVVRLVEALRQTQQLNNTVLVFTSDNGWFAGEHRMPNGKVLAYEPSAHVPMLISGPGFPKGVSRAQPTSNIDLAATFMELARAKAERDLDGESLLPFARDPNFRSDRAVLTEADFQRPVAGITGVPGVSKAERYRSIRTTQWKYILHLQTGEEELYDLSKDPFEIDSRHADPALSGIKAVASSEAGRTGRLQGSRMPRVGRLTSRAGVVAAPGAEPQQLATCGPDSRPTFDVCRSERDGRERLLKTRARIADLSTLVAFGIPMPGTAAVPDARTRSSDDRIVSWSGVLATGRR